VTLFVGLDVLCPILARIGVPVALWRPGAVLYALIASVCVAAVLVQVNLMAAWTVAGPGPWLFRLPTVAVFMVLLWYALLAGFYAAQLSEVSQQALVDGSLANRAVGNAQITLVAYLAMCLVLACTLRIGKRRITGFGDGLRVFQFSIGHVLLWTTGVAAVIGWSSFLASPLGWQQWIHLKSVAFSVVLPIVLLHAAFADLALRAGLSDRRDRPRRLQYLLVVLLIVSVIELLPPIAVTVLARDAVDDQVLIEITFVMGAVVGFNWGQVLLQYGFWRLMWMAGHRLRGPELPRLLAMEEGDEPLAPCTRTSGQVTPHKRRFAGAHPA